jgi:hypothetical protein
MRVTILGTVIRFDDAILLVYVAMNVLFAHVGRNYGKMMRRHQRLDGARANHITVQICTNETCNRLRPNIEIFVVMI